MPNRLPLIEYLRGLAALSVAWFHLTLGYGPDSWVRLSGSHGGLGVEVFFVISGFVIPLSIATQYQQPYSISQFPNFLARRLIRLEPPYLTSVALVLILWQLSYLVPGFSGSPQPWNPLQVLAHFLYVVPLTEYEWLQPVYWTLAWEFAFYISLGLSFPLIAGADGRVSWYLFVTVLFGLTTAGAVSHLALLFVIGVAVYRATHCDLLSIHRAACAVTVGVAGLIIAMNRIDIATVGVLTGVVIYFLRSVQVDGLLHRTLILLGTYSYSLYLTHWPIGARIANVGRRFIDGPIGELFLSLFALMCSLIFAAIFFRLIERPSIALAKKLKGRR